MPRRMTRRQEAGSQYGVEALQEIAKHPHNDYEHPSNGGGSYGIGTADGHRCAAEVARRALNRGVSLWDSELLN